MSDEFAWLDKWRQVEAGNWWCSDTVATNVRWHVSKRDDGWHWYTIDWSSSPMKTSSEFGPFTSWMAAAADCESAHRQETKYE